MERLRKIEASRNPVETSADLDVVSGWPTVRK
jgi:hypothetical protein